MINREERNLCAILYHLLMKPKNFGKFLEMVRNPFPIVENEMGIYFEYAFLRDLWNTIKDDSEKKGFICKHLDIDGTRGLANLSTLEFNRLFGSCSLIKNNCIHSPSSWSIRKFDSTIINNDDFFKTCIFKWSFNAKADIVIHTSLDHAICIEAKYESSEGRYPANSIESGIFKRRSDLQPIYQTSLQKYYMESLLGLDARFVFLVEKKNQKSTSHTTILWGDLFRQMDYNDSPFFIKEWLGKFI